MELSDLKTAIHGKITARGLSPLMWNNIIKCAMFAVKADIKSCKENSCHDVEARAAVSCAGSALRELVGNELYDILQQKQYRIADMYL